MMRMMMMMMMMMMMIIMVAMMMMMMMMMIVMKMEMMMIVMRMIIMMMVMITFTLISYGQMLEDLFELTKNDLDSSLFFPPATNLPTSTVETQEDHNQVAIEALSTASSSSSSSSSYLLTISDFSPATESLLCGGKKLLLCLSSDLPEDFYLYKKYMKVMMMLI